MRPSSQLRDANRLHLSSRRSVPAAGRSRPGARSRPGSVAVTGPFARYALTADRRGLLAALDQLHSLPSTVCCHGLSVNLPVSAADQPTDVPVTRAQRDLPEPTQGPDLSPAVPPVEPTTRSGHGTVLVHPFDPPTARTDRPGHGMIPRRGQEQLRNRRRHQLHRGAGAHHQRAQRRSTRDMGARMRAHRDGGTAPIRAMYHASVSRTLRTSGRSYQFLMRRSQRNIPRLAGGSQTDPLPGNRSRPLAQSVEHIHGKENSELIPLSR